jgi:predicted RNA-binding protein with PUA domain
MKKDKFQRFVVKNSEYLGKAVEAKKIGADDQVLIIERNGEKLAFAVAQIAYHHVAQGELAGEAYLVTF